MKAVLKEKIIFPIHFDQVSTDSEGAEQPCAQRTDGQRTSHQLNSKARHYLICVITKSEYDNVHNCEPTKEICDTLALAHEGSSQVKETKINLLVHQYELFKMEEHVTIYQIFIRF